MTTTRQPAALNPWARVWAALAFAAALVTPAISATASAAPAPVVAPAPASPMSPARQRDYAAREAASPQTADFQGNGAGIYIGGSTLAVVLLIVLIILLL
ncbi:MAG TPA: hypothetical protein VHJ20_12355 [Polyangia bacterium]|nr:hypothetical protein [Polyangia bacterium]